MMDLQPALTYVNSFWGRLVRHHPLDEGTRIGLPRPYMVPADGAMFQEFYYWDCFFMGLGLVGTAYEPLIEDMLENMLFLFNRFGVIPNASRYYFLSRSQPPFLTAMAWLTYACKQRRGDADALALLERAMAVAAEEHETVWLGTAQPHHRQVHAGLSRYFDINYLNILASCESGWDHSNRCSDRWLDHLPVDLNAILYLREQDLARAARLLGHPAAAVRWETRAAERASVMQHLMWDAPQGFFFDYNWRTAERHPRPSLAGFYPLWAGLATHEQAAQMVQVWLPRFLKRGGLVTSLTPKKGRQWAYPNGWAPLQWIVVAGLERYGYHQAAHEVMQRWCNNCATIFQATGLFWEKYAVTRIGVEAEGGLYGELAGFGWSNAVFADFARRLATDGSRAI